MSAPLAAITAVQPDAVVEAPPGVGDVAIADDRHRHLRLRPPRWRSSLPTRLVACGAGASVHGDPSAGRWRPSPRRARCRSSFQPGRSFCDGTGTAFFIASTIRRATRFFASERCAESFAGVKKSIGHPRLMSMKSAWCATATSAAAISSALLPTRLHAEEALVSRPASMRTPHGGASV